MRFGKSLVLSMLENYYDVAKKETFDTLFRHLAIGADPTALHNKKKGSWKQMLLCLFLSVALMQADLIYAKDIPNKNVTPGDGLTLEFRVLNAGFAEANNTHLDFYISTNDYISSSAGVYRPDSLEPDIRVEPLEMIFVEPDVPNTAVSIQIQADVSRIIGREVHFKRKTVTPALTRNMKADLDRVCIGRYHTLIQFEDLPLEETYGQLAKQGITLLSYLPDQTFWAGVQTGVVLDDIKTAGGISWAWVPDAMYKISPRIDAGNFPPNAMHSDGRVSLRVLVFEDVDIQGMGETIEQIGGDVMVVGSPGRHILEVKTPEAVIGRIAELDGVHWIEPANPPRGEQNQTSAARIHADRLKNPPYAVDGAPVTIGVWDAGAVDAHIDFGSRLAVVDNVDVNQHATHVAGTVGGNGVGDVLAAGMAPAVQIRSYDWNNDTTEMRDAADYDDVVISNHSYGYIAGWYWDGSDWVDYGNSGFGLYDSNAQAYDDLVYDSDLLAFKAAGNDRNDGPDCPGGPQCDGTYNTIGYVGNAKNILTIGALEDTDDMSGFSSWGPSGDGRIKPDLCANGTSLWSTLKNNSYGHMSGTSMASPSAAGTAALLFHHFRNLTGSNPSAALLKTLMIHGARDLGTVGPDYRYGWGIIDAEASADLISAMAYTESLIIGTGDQREFSFEVSGDEVKVTLGWTDPAGDPAAAGALVNDLNLVLISPGGLMYNPWIMDPIYPENAAGTGINQLDNVEQVLLPDPESGTWTARVSGFAVPYGPQRFALAGNGIVPGASQVLIFHNDGTAPLAVTGIEPETTAPWISVVPTHLDVPAGESRTALVQVDYDQAPELNVTVRLLIWSDDPDENPYPDGVDVTVVTKGESCLGDFDRDGDVDEHDLAVMAGNFGLTECPDGALCPADFDYDGDTDGADLSFFVPLIMGTRY